ADPAPARAVDHAVGVAPAAWTGWLRRQRLRRACRIRLAIKPAVGKAREVENTIRDKPGAPAIFMHAGTHVERLGNHIGRIGAAGPRAHDDIAALFLRPAFEPVDVSAIEPNVCK